MFKEIPIPPTVNQIYAGKTRRYKSPKYKQWLKEFDIYYAKNSSFHGARNIIRDALKDVNTFLDFKLDFCVPREKIYSKANTVKRIDVSNRIKPLFDAMSEALQCDDNRFFLNSVQFVIFNNVDNNFKPYVDVSIKTIKIRERSYVE